MKGSNTWISLRTKGFSNSWLSMSISEAKGESKPGVLCSWGPIVSPTYSSWKFSITIARGIDTLISYGAKGESAYLLISGDFCSSFTTSESNQSCNVSFSWYSYSSPKSGVVFKSIGPRDYALVHSSSLNLTFPLEELFTFLVPPIGFRLLVIFRIGVFSIVALDEDIKFVAF